MATFLSVVGKAAADRPQLVPVVVASTTTALAVGLVTPRSTTGCSIARCAFSCSPLPTCARTSGVPSPGSSRRPGRPGDHLYHTLSRAFTSAASGAMSARPASCSAASGSSAATTERPGVSVA